MDFYFSIRLKDKDAIRIIKAKSNKCDFIEGLILSKESNFLKDKHDLKLMTNEIKELQLNIKNMTERLTILTMEHDKFKNEIITKYNLK